MKNSIISLLLGLLIVSCNSLHAQSFEKINGAIRNGNASEIASSFGTNVELTIKETGANYSKNQAQMILRDFFISHQPKAFAINHEGASPEGAKYIIGNLTTSAGNFRVYVYAKPGGGNLIIQQMRFEAQ